jgi:hypothetical protein
MGTSPEITSFHASKRKQEAMNKQTTQKAEDPTKLLTDTADFLARCDAQEGAVVSMEAPPLQKGFQAYVGLVARQRQKRYSRVYREDVLIHTIEEGHALIRRGLVNAMQRDHLTEIEAQERLGEGRTGSRLFFIPEELGWVTYHVGRTSTVASPPIYEPELTEIKATYATWRSDRLHTIKAASDIGPEAIIWVKEAETVAWGA